MAIPENVVWGRMAAVMRLFQQKEPLDIQDLADFSILTAYHAERDRGLVHTPEWRARMAQLQQVVDARFQTSGPADPPLPPR